MNVETTFQTIHSALTNIVPTSESVVITHEKLNIDTINALNQEIRKSVEAEIPKTEQEIARLCQEQSIVNEYQIRVLFVRLSLLINIAQKKDWTFDPKKLETTCELVRRSIVGQPLLNLAGGLIGLTDFWGQFFNGSNT